MCSVSFRSAIVIIPPSEVWTQIQEIRSVNDKAYARWMPHINLVYPFIDDKGANLTDAAHKIKSALDKKGIKPFKVTFNKDAFGNFKHGIRSTVWLKPLASPKAPASGRITKQMKQTGFHCPPASRDHDFETKTPPSEQIYCPTSGLDNLANAVWTPMDNLTLNLRPSDLQPGLDALRFAVWGADDEHANQTKILADRKYIQGAHPGDHCSLSQIGQSINDHSEEDVGNRTDSDDVTFNPLDLCQSVLDIHKVLEGMYPNCCNVSGKSTDVFHPHLTLGQTPSTKVTEFIGNYASRWRPFTFDVTAIYIITREHDKDPMKIKHTISLLS